MKKQILKLILLLVLVIGCEGYVDPVITEVNEINDLLQNHKWTLIDYQVMVRNQDIPSPLMVSIDNHMIKAGHYSIKDALASDDGFPIYKMIFNSDNGIFVDSTNSGDFIDNGSSYFVLNNYKIRLKTAGIEKLPYDYFYDANTETMHFTIDSEGAQKVIDDITNQFVDYAVKATPNKVGDAIAKILDKPIIQRKIHNFIVQALANKIQGWENGFDPEEAANDMADKIMEWLDSQDWQQILSEAINNELQKLLDFDPDTLAPEMAQEIADKIAEKFSEENIYNAILPYMNEFDQDPDALASQISQAVLNMLGTIFSQNNLEEIIYPIWENYTNMSDDSITQVADKLTEIVQDNWLNENNLTSLFLPVTEKIDETQIVKLDDLADEATRKIETLLNELNTKFPSLALNPDYDAIDSAIHVALLAAKPIIGTKGPEEVAKNLADIILNNFLTTENIENAFETILHDLQEIDPQMAAETIASWLVSIESKIAPEIYDWLVQKLSPILENYNPEEAAERIAKALNEWITDKVSADNLEPYILQLLEEIQGVNTALLANLIAEKILDSPLIKDGITQEQLAELLLPIMEKIHDLDPEKVAVAIVHALESVTNDLFTPERIGKIVTVLMYKTAYENMRIANNFQQLTIIIKHD